jgi:hypothetical protein
MSRRALTQMDSAVDQTMSRSTSEQGADRAAQLRRSQATERNRLLKEIDTEQRKIQTLNDQRAPIAAEVRKVEAEVGPIKYIAALIYGDSPEANLLDKAVRWVIILIVIVFDPLALTLLLAATKSIEWERDARAKRPEPNYERDDGPLTDDQIKQIKETAQDDLPTGQVITKQSLFDPDVTGFFDKARQTAQAIDADTYEPPQEQPVKKQSVMAGLDNMWSRAKNLVIKDSEADHAPLSTGVQDEQESKDKQFIRAWKDLNPTDTIKHQERLLHAGVIDQLPWQAPEFQNQFAPVADNVSLGATGEMRGFGTSFPAESVKGDMFLRVDQVPSRLDKFNGVTWIEVDKSLSDQYAYNDQYIDHLIDKISTGEYDLDLLSEVERISIEHRLNNTKLT